MTTPDLQAAASAIELADGVIRGAIVHLAETGSVDADQVLAYDIAHASAAVETARSMLDYGNKGELEAKLTCVFVADAVADLGAKIWGREASWDCGADALDGARSFVGAWRDPATLADLAYQDGPRHLDSDFELVQDTFRRFAEDQLGLRKNPGPRFIAGEQRNLALPLSCCVEDLQAGVASQIEASRVDGAVG